MNAQQDDVSHELMAKLTLKELNLWRLMTANASTDEESRIAAKLLAKSLRERGARYLVRELGAGSYNAAV
jgi:hypothetical protein